MTWMNGMDGADGRMTEQAEKPKHMRYDNAVKHLQSIDPGAWAKFLGCKSESVAISNTDLSTVKSSADCVLMVDNDGHEGEHVENQTNYDSTMGERAMVYNVLASKSLGIPVRTTVILLRPEADGPALCGVYRRTTRDGRQNLEFRFDVVRVWMLSPDQVFECGLGVLPLAFIADIKPEALPNLMKRTQDYLLGVSDRNRANEVLTAIKVLMGLRYKSRDIAELMKGQEAMKESVTYQEIVAEGRKEGMATGAINEARAIVLRQASFRFGTPDAQKLSSLNSIQSVERLEILADRVLYVSNWDELLAP